MRSLKGSEFIQSEQIKFSVLYNLDYLQPIDNEAISIGLNKKLPNGVLKECE